MPEPQVAQIGNKWGIYSWTNGFIPAVKETPLHQEAKRNPEAVLNRLMREERWDEAEEIMDRCM